MKIGRWVRWDIGHIHQHLEPPRGNTTLWCSRFSLAFDPVWEWLALCDTRYATWVSPEEVGRNSREESWRLAADHAKAVAWAVRQHVRYGEPVPAPMQHFVRDHYGENLNPAVWMRFIDYVVDEFPASPIPAPLRFEGLIWGIARELGNENNKPSMEGIPLVVDRAAGVGEAGRAVVENFCHRSGSQRVLDRLWEEVHS